tara:strand:+ start:226 stop:918 length:693 start_codon:yes stop_codon:yes gene_type:complete
MNNTLVKNISLNDLTDNSNSKLKESINQKDVLIKSLKYTIDNLTNIICNNSNKMMQVNQAINNEIYSTIDSTFADQYFQRIEKYLQEINKLNIENTEIKQKFQDLNEDSQYSEKSYNILNSIYLEYIKKSKGEKHVLFERITNLSKTMDSLKELGENKIKNLRSYYQREITKSSGIKCTKCWKNNVNTVFLPCNHMVLCGECITTLSNLEEELVCPRCKEPITSKINVEF